MGFQNFSEKYPTLICGLLNEFRQYLTVRKDRDEATARAYCYDVKVFADYYMEQVDPALSGFTVSSERIIGFLDYLKHRQLRNPTVKRRLIGVYSFWKFLYRTGKTPNPPVELDDLDIIVKKTTNPTVPLNSKSFLKLRRVLKHELAQIY
jgi:site-specific recombinase XerD